MKEFHDVTLKEFHDVANEIVSILFLMWKVQLYEKL